ncbi:hypothetical protein [Brevundimonas sp.]|uniref:hypothetical protein n=1 Tax=Brevundimonas sp. TaxID=1871086 RepID=UPI003919DDC6
MRNSVVIALCALTAACASRPGPPDRPPTPQLFISPFGQPFHGEPAAPYPSAQWFLQADADGDGALSFEEFSADGMRYFRELDLDGDGVIGASEIGAYEIQLAGIRSRMMGQRGPRPPGQGRPNAGDGGPPMQLQPPGGGGQRPPGGAPPRGAPGGQGGPRGPGGGYGPVADADFFGRPQPIRSADANMDQRITPDEWVAATRRWFSALDADHDGVLTFETLPRTRAQSGPGRRRE